MTIVSVYAVFADADEAERIGRELVEEGLAACVNILGACRSIYRWQGAVETADEIAAIFKTTDQLADSLMSQIAALHSYAVPAIAVWPIQRSPTSYSKWVEQSVR